MNTRTLQKNQYAQLSSFWFSFSLSTMGIIVVFLVIMVKTKTAEVVAENPLLISYAIFITAFQFSRFISFILYNKSHKNIIKSDNNTIARIKGRRTPKYEPKASFVIPCVNEEGAIRKTVTQCFLADYPKEKLEVIVINDGSTDRTGEILKEMELEYPGLVVITFKKNKGKRYGMADGFKVATGEIIVQLDSDSYIKPETFRKLIEPFENPEIGGVCAHADPENSDVNWLTKMQTAYYYMAFRILKAAESTYGTVFCLSGCSSAYRREAVIDIMDEWLNESFLGLPVTWGDDRGLTNWVLRKNYKTIYTDEARACTIVPETFKQFIKQQIRWKKGWFVNSYFVSKFILWKQPFVAIIYFFPLTLATILTPLMATRALLYVPLFRHNASFVFYLLGVSLMTALLVIFYRMVAPNNKYWPYLFIWAGLNSLILSFLLFYSLATIQNRKWGTR